MKITNLSNVEEDDQGRPQLMPYYSVKIPMGKRSDWQSAQKFFWDSYDGIEKWQRLEVYEYAIRSGSEHQEALTQAVECPVEGLPEIIFEAVKADPPAPSLKECAKMLAEARSQDESEIEMNKFEGLTQPINTEFIDAGGDVHCKAAPSVIVGEYDFSFFSDLDLVEMQSQVRKTGEDKEFVGAILVELGKRQRERESK